MPYWCADNAMRFAKVSDVFVAKTKNSSKIVNLMLTFVTNVPTV